MKKTVSLLLLSLFVLCASFTVYGADVPRLTDGADLLSAYEEGEILTKLDEISKAWQCDIVIVTTDSLGGSTPNAYADDWFDSHGFGFGDSYDGILLLVSMEERDAALSTCGRAISLFAGAAEEEIWDSILPDLSAGDYADAFLAFADVCEFYISHAQADPDGYYDGGYDPGFADGYYDGGYDSASGEGFRVGSALLISLVGGLVIALIAVSIMKGKLRSVRKQESASQYVKGGSMNVTGSSDLFLYRNVRRIPKPTNNSSGGSGMRISSSGRSHGGGSRKF